jgi:hypothetical protein
MNNAATADDLPCKRKSCLSDGDPGAPIAPGQTACSPADSGKTLKGILKEKIRAWVVERAIVILFVGLIIAIMHFWLGLIR